MESLLCPRSMPLFLTFVHFVPEAGGISALCTFLGSKSIVYFTQVAIKPWDIGAPPKSALFILGESPFCSGLCFCFSWSCMTLHSFSKDKITHCTVEIERAHWWGYCGFVNGQKRRFLGAQLTCKMNVHYCVLIANSLAGALKAFHSKSTVCQMSFNTNHGYGVHIIIVKPYSSLFSNCPAPTQSSTNTLPSMKGIGNNMN